MSYGQMDPEGSWPTSGERTFANHVTDAEVDAAQRWLDDVNQRVREMHR